VNTRWKPDKWTTGHTADFAPQNDPKSVIIKRWVPEYEQEFLWDHTRKLREGRGHKNDPPRPRHVARPSEYTRDRSESPPRSRRYEKATTNSKKNVDYGRRTPPVTSTRGREAPDYYNASRRHASTESMRPVPNTDEVARMRKHSRTLSGERPVSTRQRSSESVRYTVVEPPSPPPAIGHRQVSYESVRYPRDNQANSYRYSSDTEKKEGSISKGYNWMGQLRRRSMDIC
jgi:hypothetical protein